ncbi:MAG TPA: polysaccharide deacetylase family protein [Solirubrobacteraceae bacterium]|nr:polysaccharide deacetylase family protein [Solirubrobacteraceae bacterium]
MDSQHFPSRRAERAQERRRRMIRRRMAVVGCLVIAVAAAAVAVGSVGGGSSRNTPPPASASAPGRPGAGGHRRAGANHHKATHARGNSTAAGLGVPTGHPGTATVPVLMYHVIAPPPPGAPFPGLYVTPAEFQAQMQALKAAGWTAVTLDQMRTYWSNGAKLPPGKPIVLTFDNGYHSQYTQALPVLRRLGWPADENIQLTGLPPSQGGMTPSEVRGLVNAGWELDTQGMSHADLATADAAQLRYQIVTARSLLRREYGVPVNWFCYPSGQYNATVIAALHAAGYVGSTTVVPGWAGASTDPYRLPRLRVLGGTSPSALLAQIASARSNGQPPGSYVTS